MGEPEFGTLRAEHDGVTLECRAMAPGLSIHDLVVAFEDAKAQAKPGDEFAASPSRWPEVRGVTAVCNAVTTAMLGREQADTARTLELVAEWLKHKAQLHHRLAIEAKEAGDREVMSTHSSISHTCLSNARDMEDGAFVAWLKEREGRGGHHDGNRMAIDPTDELHCGWLGTGASEPQRPGQRQAGRADHPYAGADAGEPCRG